MDIISSPGIAAPVVGLFWALGGGALAMLLAWRVGQRRERERRARAAALRSANQNLQRLAFRDPLTGLPNRLHFEEQLGRAVARAEKENIVLALLFIDLDGFKPINDGWGHAQGDQVLREVGRRLGGLIDDGVSAARAGGDEFLLLAEGGADIATALARRVLAHLAQPVRAGEREFQLSGSIGIVLFPQHGSRAQLLARADAAMFEAKRSGGGTFMFYEPRMENQTHEPGDLVADLRRAIEEGGLELLYQPKVNARTGEVTAAEALLRWHHPQRGMISPTVFIPMAERGGLIGALGAWVIETACAQVRQWREQGLRMRLAINVSAHQVRQEGLVELVQQQLRRHKIHPSLLTLEITESVAMEDSATTQEVFARLGAAGLRLSIDDFGTGYSSLTYLRRLPADELKIDTSFVSDLETSDDARAIVEAVVGLAHALKLKVVAEGVENERQQMLLVDIGCDELQGFLFARPMTGEALAQWALPAAEQPASASRAQQRGFRRSLFDNTHHAGLH
jgi:diguanylate cyclase (GGDEF)-like protein